MPLHYQGQFSYNASVLTVDDLKDILNDPGLARRDRVLICLAVDAEKPKSVSQLQKMAISSGLREAAKWNFSAILSSLGKDAIRTNDGWELTSAGKTTIQKLLAKSPLVKSHAISSLRKTLKSIPNGHTRVFAREAIECFEGKHYRAAVVLSWVGGLSLLYDCVLQEHLTSFNAEARRRDSKWKDAKTTDDFSRMKEYDFLQVLESISVIGKSVKRELENCLALRNGCGHPNNLKIEVHRVASHIEVLVLNIFSVFSK